ncbi:MAG: 3-hydroxyacyl-CoA dehydrogenase family protein [Lachnospiraceae bacterium]|nr:3-hydroxyacyl-CoA dehydrogenase family protein [Lachnospiraceae bacterium]
MNSSSQIKKVAGIGGGIIGSSWVVLFALKGKDITLYARSEESVNRQKKTIEDNLEFLLDNGVIDSKDDVGKKITYTTDLEAAVTDADFIQESGPEKLEFKQEILARIESCARTDAIIATSASTLPLDMITEKAIHPERCIGGHPYNPPHLIPLVEITKTEKTSPEVIKIAKDFYVELGKEPVVLQKACPGYICNRLQLAVFREMIDLVERGVCTVEEADRALTFGPAIRWAIFGHNMVMQVANKNGIKGMMDMLAGGYNLCADIASWDTLPEDYGDKAQAAVNEIMKNNPDEIGHTNAEIAAYRDRMLIDILKLHHKF